MQKENSLSEDSAAILPGAVWTPQGRFSHLPRT